jgi:hypothetical protein
MAWYSVGTVKTTANSAVVIGTGTAWTNSGLRPGDMMLIGYSTISPRGYEIKSIDNATQITLVLPFPIAANGAGYVGIPMLSGDRTAITMTLATQISKALADTEAMSSVYQTFYTSPGTVSLTLPGGLVIYGSSFQKLTADMAGKATLVSGAVPINQGGTGSTWAAGGLANLGGLPISGGTSTGVLKSTGGMYVVAQTSGYAEFGYQFPNGFARLAYNFTENLGDYVIVTTDRTIAGTEKYFAMRKTGQFTTQGNITCLSLTQTSDADKKDHITPIENALDKLSRVRGVTYVMKEDGTPSAGVIAQELMKELPEAVGSTFDDYDQYGEVEEEVPVEVVNENGEKSTITEIRKVIRLIRKRDDSKRSYTVEYSGVIALAVQAINELSEKVRVLEAEVASLRSDPAS